MLELLANAGKFSSPNTTVFVQATQQLNGSDRQMTISVTNRGSGLSEEEQESIFEKFQRGKNAPEGTEQGTGLGLALVKSLVLHLGGTISVSSVDIEEALAEVCFTVTLP
ncbi:MAG: sensor histidine kinase [Chloroflexaceae bacterium]|nr:sensor histidine kinase [Chloroflexaceae bacterium]